ATDAKLRPLVEASGGGVIWLSDYAEPDLRSVRPGRAAAGSDWVGLRRNEGYTVAGINQLPLLPGILVALAFLLAIASAWWREGRWRPPARAGRRNARSRGRLRTSACIASPGVASTVGTAAGPIQFPRASPA